MRRVVKAMSRTITAIVTNYFKDYRLCDSLLSLSDEAKAVLRVVDGKPYQMYVCDDVICGTDLDV